RVRSRRGAATAWCLCSSSRRQTSFSRDWSSDVCSSDLTDSLLRSWPETVVSASQRLLTEYCGCQERMLPIHRNIMLVIISQAKRSEERRVGKEGGPARAPCRASRKQRAAGVAGQALDSA